MKKILILGASAAGIGVLNKLRLLAPEAHITCVTAEQELPYNKCLLAEYCSGEKQEQDVYTKNKQFFQDQQIDFLTGARVVRIDTAARVVHAISAQEPVVIPYDKLFVGLGTQPIVPPIPGIDQEGVYTFHYLRDVQKIKERVATARRAVVIGAGLSGLEAADALHKQGIQVTLVEAGARMLATTLDAQGHAHFIEILRAAGVSVLLQNPVVAITGKQGHVSGVICADGMQLSADLVIVAVGSRPDMQLFADTGIAHTADGLIVDNHMRTSDPVVWAGGDICIVNDQLTGTAVRSALWPDAMMQGMYAAYNMTGHERVYPGIIPFHSSSFFGQRFASCGVVTNVPDTCDELVMKTESGYHLFVVDRVASILRGFVMLGDARHVGRARRALVTHEVVTPDILASFSR